MIQFNKIIFRFCLGILSALLLFSSCTKDGNPNHLPTSVPESEITGKTGSDVIKILAIGNSFSEDAVETHLYNLAKTNGQKVIIGNMYIGSASLAQHVKNANNNAASYEYRKIDTAGVRKNYTRMSIATALADENWDYISFQQVSDSSGIYSSFEKTLPALYNYVKDRALNPQVKYLLHQTWAYAQSSTHAAFPLYNKDQATMYHAIVDAYSKAKNLIPADIVIPSGTAIQDARTSLVGDNFTRDGYHLSIPMGRYTAACTWYEAIFGKPVVGNSYKPAEMSEFEKSICQNAAHFAVQKPNDVTIMSDFQGTGSFDGPIFVNFSSITANRPDPGMPWNTITTFTAGASVSLKNSTNNYTGVGLTIAERFNGLNEAGEATTTTAFNMPASVSGTSFFGNAIGVFGGLSIPKSVIKLTGLNKDSRYTLCYFGSRNQSSDNRETQYTNTGTNTVVVRLNTSNNTSNIACAENVQPDANGTITVTITAGPNNNNSSGFFYLNAMRITNAQ